MTGQPTNLYPESTVVCIPIAKLIAKIPITKCIVVILANVVPDIGICIDQKYDGIFLE